MSNEQLELPPRVKDHVLSGVVNRLRDVALQYHAAGQLRSRIQEAVAPLVGGVDRDAPVKRVKAFVCKSCHGVYLEQPVTQCDCMPDNNEFIEGVLSYPGSAWTPVGDGLPDVDEDGLASVWAVNVGCPGFRCCPAMSEARYHATLGWQPYGSTGWDWIVTHWMHYPELPC